MIYLFYKNKIKIAPKKNKYNNFSGYKIPKYHNKDMKKIPKKPLLNLDI